jgi:hypothetical protein
VGALLLTGCARPPAALRPSPLTLKTRTFERALPGCGDQEKRPEPCATFRVLHPDVTQGVPPEVQARINARILAALRGPGSESFDAEAAALFAEYTQHQEESADAAQGLFVRRTAEVLTSNAAVLSIAVEEDAFRGGEAPSARRTYLNLRPDTGEDWRLEEVVAPEALPRLSAIASEVLQAEQGLDVSVTLNRNWGVERRGLVFCFNAGDLGAQESGPVEVVLRWERIRGLVRKECDLIPLPR